MPLFVHLNLRVELPHAVGMVMFLATPHAESPTRLTQSNSVTGMQTMPTKSFDGESFDFALKLQLPNDDAVLIPATRIAMSATAVEPR